MTASPPYRYRPFVLAELARWGIVPAATTEPRAAYGLLKAIYSYEIRRMRALHKEKESMLGPQPFDDYRRGLHALKAKYRVLKLTPEEWLDG